MSARSTGKEIIGYFVQWGVAQHGYSAKNIVSSGSADRLTVINYAFANIGEDLRCAIRDPLADYGRAFDAGESVDGIADAADQPLRGNFEQLRKLKHLYPHLKVLISIGGWTDSHCFSDAALPENRDAFVRSCVDVFIRGNFGPGVSGPAIFDGIDVDWEYPAVIGHGHNVYRPEDTRNFTLLLAEFRRQLDAIDPNLMLTIAAPAPERCYSKIELGEIHQYLDWINLMTYDFHGSWEMTTNHHSSLYSSPSDPTGGMSSDAAVQAFLAAGVPADKLVLGVPFYGRGWAGVPKANNGLYQLASGFPQGPRAQNTGYRSLKKRGMAGFWDEVAHATWLYDGDEFWTLDDETSMAHKTGYVNDQGLAGVMFWELCGDDDGGSLIAAIDDGLHRPRTSA